MFSMMPMWREVFMGECFCLSCGCKQPYRVKSQNIVTVIRGVRVLCPEETAVCAICGEEVYTPEVNDRNVDYRLRAYKEAVRND